MKKKTTESLRMMRQLVISFMSIANSIDEDEWIQIVKSIRGEKDKLSKIERGAELGNIFFISLYISEILESLLSKTNTNP